MIITNGNLMMATRYNRPMTFSTYKTQCPERDVCSSFEEWRCEKPVTDGIVKHLVLSSERVASGPNVWTELQNGDVVSVDGGMNFRRGVLASLQDTHTAKLPIVP